MRRKGILIAFFLCERALAELEIKTASVRAVPRKISGPEFGTKIILPGLGTDRALAELK